MIQRNIQTISSRHSNTRKRFQ